MRNLIDNLRARHFIVLSLALMLVLGGVSAAFANRDGEQARKVFADPELTLALPPHVTAATGMDALTHAVEAFIGRWATPHSDRMALAEAGLISEGLTLDIDWSEGPRKFYNNGKWIKVQLAAPQCDSTEPADAQKGPLSPPPELPKLPKPQLHVIKFTTVGQSLGSLIADSYNERYLALVAERYSPLGIEIVLVDGV